MTALTEQFRNAISAAGLTPPDEIEADGKLRRFASTGKRGDDAGWYVLHDDGIPAGSFGDWRNGFSQTWRADVGRKLSPAEEAAHRARINAMRREREAEEGRAHQEAAARAVAIWQAAKPAPEDHQYLTCKGIKPHGARIDAVGSLLIPLRDGSEILSLQTITSAGVKRFLPGGRVAGCYFAIGNPAGAAALAICEGFATGASIHEATGLPVAVAFSAGNLQAVAQSMRGKFPALRLILCADDDYRTEGNPGQAKATEAAQVVDGMLALPDFGGNRPEGATDFNDLNLAQGPEAVKRAIDTASAPNSRNSGNSSSKPHGAEWPDPLPLAAKFAPEPYPTDALPNTIRAAVGEVAAFVKAPVPLVAASALGALSLACQAHFDVKRADKLQGPVSLFLLSVADSGERKSTCDGFFVAAIRQYQDEQAEALAPAIKEHAAALAAWEAEREGILSAIKATAKAGKSADSLKRDLAELQHGKPEAPRVPRLLLGDETPEALAWNLAKNWPSAGVQSSEAGLILGAHGMGRDSVMRNLALLNLLWDGGTHSIGRRTSESFTVRGARLTVALQVQEATLRSFFDKAGPLARGTGFLARFLVAWPESTQGGRFFDEAPPNWPHLAAFHRRIAAILAIPAPMDDDGGLAPALLSLTPEAKRAWVRLHDAIEAELSSGGELYDVRDVASKAADNAARLAALFQVFESGAGGAIGLEAFESASRIAAWHLSEARRFFGELALPAELADAARLDSWLIEHCRRKRTHFAKKNHVRQHGPLRDGARLDAAIRELAELDRLRLEKDGKRLTIHLNPALMGVAP